MKKSSFLLMILMLQYVSHGQGIDTTITVTINGINQAVKIKGRDQTKPLLLYLHGAANTNYSLIANADKLTRQLQDLFVVALWDQRDYGETYKKNHSPQAPTLSMIERDAIDMVDTLLQRFHRKKLLITAHSMGCVLGAAVAQKHPEKLYALVQISPPVNGIESQRISLQVLKKYFKEQGNTRAIKELATVRIPARDFQSLFIKYIWQTEHDGEHIPDSTREQLKPMLAQWMHSPAAILSNEVFELSFFKRFPTFNCPVYFFIGRKDLLTNARLSEQYERSLMAPKKQLYWFDKSGHDVPGTEAGKMQELIVDSIWHQVLK